ncbi:MAG: hypothetical protein LUD77_10490 [Clostridiales bacterium]|nr:hypothetical protein [Clostridiales bacterium]
MLSFVKLNDNGGIWANRDEALAYLAIGYKVYTGVDQTVEMTEEDLNAIVECDTRAAKSRTVAVAVNAEG